MNFAHIVGVTAFTFFTFATCSIHAQGTGDDASVKYTLEYDIASRSYDLRLAYRLTQRLDSELTSDSHEKMRWLAAKSFLLVAELNRIEFEETPELERSTRRNLGNRIDEAADRGLAQIDQLPEVSEKYRLRADMLGTKIRTRFHAKKYRKRMESSILRARELDETNVLALVSEAKPFLFAGERHGGNIERAVELLDRALRLDSDNEHALVLRGFAFKELGRRDLAENDWGHALENNPLCRPARYGLEH